MTRVLLSIPRTYWEKDGNQESRTGIEPGPVLGDMGIWESVVIAFQHLGIGRASPWFMIHPVGGLTRGELVIGRCVDANVDRGAKGSPTV
jgi:hypothetical protein